MIGAKVDALALMLDGTCNADGYRPSGVWVNDLVRSGEQSWLAIRRDNGDFGEVAEAILELEALADWSPLRQLGDCPIGELAESALVEVGFWDVDDDAVDSFDAVDNAIREAAAILRDGWRPEPQRKEAP